jgi:pimeloyl-ACP methyl ester carboxylesterase
VRLAVTTEHLPEHQDAAGSGRGRRFFGRLARVVAVLVALVLAGTLWESAAEAADRRAYPPPGQLVDMGGYSLHINCVGSGAPTVVIEAGLGDWSASWSSWVQPEVAKRTRVCTYDRAGFGWSDAGPPSRTAQHFAQELHALLQRASVPGPYVLVGHSLGGLTVRLFARDYRADVAGVVLIDSMHPDQATGPRPDPSAEPSATDGDLSLTVLAARIGLVRLLAGPLDLKGGLSPAVADAYAAHLVTPRTFQAQDRESAGLAISLSQAAGVTSLGDLPLIVVSRGLDPDPKWQRMQMDLLSLSSDIRQRIADESGHNVQIDQPEVATAAIVEMVDQLRPRPQP